MGLFLILNQHAIEEDVSMKYICIPAESKQENKNMAKLKQTSIWQLIMQINRIKEHPQWIWC